MYFSPPRLAAEARPVRPRADAVRTAQCWCFDFMVTFFVGWAVGVREIVIGYSLKVIRGIWKR